MCRAVFGVEEEKENGQGKTAASSLPINHFASTVLAAASPSSSSSHADSNNVVCEGCDENQATEYCKECSMTFCAICKRAHLKPKAFPHHQFILLDEEMKPGGGGAVSRVTRCDKHPQQEINTYCQTDKQAICSECAIDFHQEHKIERLVKVVQGFKDEITQLVYKVCSLFLSCDSSSLPHPLMAPFEIIRSRNTMVTYLRLLR